MSSFPRLISKLLVLALALLLSGLFTSCAHNADADRPWHRKDKKWYQGDMDNDDRRFFLDTFFNGR